MQSPPAESPSMEIPLCIRLTPNGVRKYRLREGHNLLVATEAGYLLAYKLSVLQSCNWKVAFPLLFPPSKQDAALDTLIALTHSRGVNRLPGRWRPVQPNQAHRPLHPYNRSLLGGHILDDQNYIASSTPGCSRVIPTTAELSFLSTYRVLAPTNRARKILIRNKALSLELAAPELTFIPGMPFDAGLKSEYKGRGGPYVVAYVPTEMAKGSKKDTGLGPYGPDADVGVRGRLAGRACTVCAQQAGPLGERSLDQCDRHKDGCSHCMVTGLRCSYPVDALVGKE
ncbi:MAG: hypothetical protein MMC23_001101 [Stictis urceolatum]|nr:hypothetical protein [Stictis urceolata]